MAQFRTELREFLVLNAHEQTEPPSKIVFIGKAPTKQIKQAHKVKLKSSYKFD